MCRKGGFRLHKFLSNERRVIESIEIENRATEVKKLDLVHDVLPVERVLGRKRNGASKTMPSNSVLR
jgi:hypothetical protein